MALTELRTTKLYCADCNTVILVRKAEPITKHWRRSSLITYKAWRLDCPHCTAPLIVCQVAICDIAPKVIGEVADEPS